jgi:hypothetical protein
MWLVWLIWTTLHGNTTWIKFEKNTYNFSSHTNFIMQSSQWCLISFSPAIQSVVLAITWEPVRHAESQTSPRPADHNVLNKTLKWPVTYTIQSLLASHLGPSWPTCYLTSESFHQSPTEPNTSRFPNGLQFQDSLSLCSRWTPRNSDQLKYFPL